MGNTNIPERAAANLFAMKQQLDIYECAQKLRLLGRCFALSGVSWPQPQDGGHNQSDDSGFFRSAALIGTCHVTATSTYLHSPNTPQVENGDLNWILPGKFVAFSGPAARSNEVAGYRLHTPEDYWDYYRRKGVTTVIRLNKKVSAGQRNPRA